MNETKTKVFMSVLDGISYCLRNPICVAQVYVHDLEVAYDMFCYLSHRGKVGKVHERPKLSIRFHNDSVLNALEFGYD